MKSDPTDAGGGFYGVKYDGSRNINSGNYRSVPAKGSRRNKTHFRAHPKVQNAIRFFSREKKMTLPWKFIFRDLKNNTRYDENVVQKGAK